MKLPNSPRTAALSLTAVSAAFICGMAVTTHQQAPVHLSGSYKTVDTTSTDPTAPTSAPTTTTPSSTTTQPTTTTAPQASVVTASPSSSQNLSTSTTTTQTTTQSDPTPPAVTAVSADLQPWTAPVPADPADNQPQGTTVQYNYCVWTYSDSSTQQAAVQIKYIYPQPPYTGGTHLAITEELIDTKVACDLAHAPAAN